MNRLRRRLDAGPGKEAGFTLIEMLVAASMSIILLGAIVMMLVSVVRTQPKISEKAENVTAARWVLERMTREIRNGVSVYAASPTQVSFLASVRRSACGAGVQEDPKKPAIRCRVTYTCASGTCSRRESAEGGVDNGPQTTIVTGLASDQVFNYTPNDEPTYIGMTLRIPNPEERGELRVSDGASLRTLSLPQPDLES